MKSCAAVITAMMLAFHVSAMAHEMTDMAARQPGAVTASAGIVYVPIREGSGRFPEIRDRVVVTYRGMFSDGKEFEKAEAVTFPLSGVITCWTLGIQYMKVGGKGKLYCAPDKAYGSKGSPPVIPRNAALIFEIELLEVK